MNASHSQPPAGLGATAGTGDAWSGFVEVTGGRLWAECAGAGPGVVLVHAGIGDSRMWDPQWDALAAHGRVVRYDCRGFGRSETSDVAFSNRADLLAVMDASGLSRATLVGASRGGAVAIDTALEFPDRVTALVSVGGGIGGLPAQFTEHERTMYERSETLWQDKAWEAAADLDLGCGSMARKRRLVEPRLGCGHSCDG